MQPKKNSRSYTIARSSSIRCRVTGNFEFLKKKKNGQNYFFHTIIINSFNRTILTKKKLCPLRGAKRNEKNLQ